MGVGQDRLLERSRAGSELGASLGLWGLWASKTVSSTQLSTGGPRSTEKHQCQAHPWAGTSVLLGPSGHRLADCVRTLALSPWREALRSVYSTQAAS